MKTIIQYLQDVLTVVQYDLDANPSEVASLLAREYYSKPTVQVIVNATDSIAQNKLHRESNEAHDQQLPRPLAQNNAPSLEPDYVQDYYRQKMRSERAKQAGEVAGFGAKILGGLLQTLVDSAN